MRQRTHGPTTAAASHKPSEAQVRANGATDEQTPVASNRPAEAARAPRKAPLAPRTNARTAGAAARQENSSALDADAIARVLRVMADEVERDPALARRVGAATSQSARAPRDGPTSAVGPAASLVDDQVKPPSVGTRPFKARIVTGAGADLGTGIPDPFALRARLGAEGLRAALEDLRLGTLRAMVREYRLDGIGRTPQHNDAARLRQLILEASAAR